MQIVDSGNSIVILGHWNIHSFSNKWMQEKLCSKKDEPIQVGIPMNLTNAPDAPTYIAFENIKLIFGYQSLQIMAEKRSSSALAKCAEIAEKIIKNLSQTPVSGIGVNVCFEETDNPEKILSKLIFDDSKKINSDKFQFLASSARRTYLLENKCKLNFEIMSLNPDKVIMQFNYHYDIQNTTECIKPLGEVQSLYKQAIIFMKDVYELELGEISEVSK